MCPHVHVVQKINSEKIGDDPLLMLLIPQDSRVNLVQIGPADERIKLPRMKYSYLSICLFVKFIGTSVNCCLQNCWSVIMLSVLSSIGPHSICDKNFRFSTFPDPW